MSRPLWPRDSGAPEPGRGCDLQASGEIELYFYDEHTPAKRAEIERHLRGCAECRVALEELQVIGEALASRPDIASPPGGDWTAFMARLGEAVAASDRQGVETPPAVREPRFGRSVARYLAAAAVVTLMAGAAVTMQRQQSSHSAVGVAGPSESPSRIVSLPDPAPARAPGFAAVSGQHFERSKLVILGLATKDAQTASAADWAYERQLASSLLDDTRIYKQAAAERGLESLAGVMSDLELVLLQTSLSDERDTATLDRLQRLIRRRDLVTKLEVFETANAFEGP